MNRTMTVRLESLTAGLVCVLCLIGSPVCIQAHEKPKSSSALHLKVVEKKLQAYLTNRVLVFREGGIDQQIRVNSRDRPQAERSLASKSDLGAIVFRGLSLDPERLVIAGEAIRVRGTSRPLFSRDPHQFRVITRTIVLDVPLDRMTFAHAISLLVKVFLTREELEGGYPLPASASDQHR